MNKRMRMTGAALVAVLGAGLLTACGGELEPTDPPKAAPSKAAEEKPAVEETPVAEAVEPAEDEGSFTNPFPVGTPVGNDEVTISLGTPADFTPQVAAGNQFNDPPVNGAYVAVGVTVQNVKAEKVTPWLDVRLKIVAADGRSWDSTLQSGVEGAFNDVGDLYPGGTGSGVVLFDMPLDATAGALVAVSYSWSDEVFVKLQ
jgi:uncharacterized protein DUF4352